MRVLRSLDELTSPLPGPALTIGNFDGVHVGHRRILQAVTEEARAGSGTAVVMTFTPHPARVLAGSAPPLLTTIGQRLRLLEEHGIEVALVLKFTRELSQLAPRTFAEEIVRRRLGTRVVCVGENFRFGHRQVGDVRLLEQAGRELGFAVRVIPPVEVGGQVASSSLVRTLVAEGDVVAAAGLLGRPYALTGALVSGAGRGRMLGFPTLNLYPEQECLPALGVYITETLVEGQLYPSATNVGLRPTFEPGPLLVESHLLDFSGRTEAGLVEVRFHERLRGEEKFASPEALRVQIERDVAEARRYFAERERKKQGIEIGR